jgi:protein O-mannosyl-transferase
MKQKRKIKSPSPSSIKEKNVSTGKFQKTRLVLTLIIGVFGFLLYSNTLSHGYVLDDFSAVKENNIVRQGIHAIPEIFKTSYRQGYLSVKDGLYRPLSLVTFAIEWNYFPDQPSVSHFINVVLYALTGMLLFFMLYNLSPYPSPLGEGGKRREVFPFITSLLFMAHPLHVEVVANIKSRDEILCFLFVICSFIAVLKFLEEGKIIFLLGGLASYFLSLLSKETSITFLALLPLALHFFSSASFKKNISTTAFFIGIAVAYLLIRHSVLQGAMADEGVSIADNIIAGAKTCSERIGTSFYILGLYVTMLFYPHTMSYDYSFNHLHIVSIGNVFSIASILFYFAIGIYGAFILYNSFKKKSPAALYKGEIPPILGFGIFFFLFTIFLFSNLVFAIGTSMGDRLMYFPSLGFCMVMAILLCPNPKGSNHNPAFKIFRMSSLGVTKGVVLCIVVSLYGLKTYSRNADWKDNYTLYSHDVKLVPNSVKAHYYLGLELIKTVAETEQNPEKKKALYEEGIRELKRSVEIMPSFGSAFTQIGVAYFRLKNFEKAIENYNKATALQQADAITLNNIGSVYFEWKKYGEASENFNKALQIDPRFVDAYMNLGSVYGTLGNFNSAIECFQNAIKYSPDNARAYFYIAMTYQNRGDKLNADKYYKIAEQMNPQLTKPH